MRKYKVISLGLVFVLAVALLGGCGSKKDTTDANTNKEEQKSGSKREENSEWTWPLTEKKELSFWMSWANSYVEDPNEMPGIAAIEEATNVHVNWVMVSDNDASEKFGLMMASGDYPDIVQGMSNYYNGGLSQAYEDGLIYDLTDYVSSYMPNYDALRHYNDQVLCDTSTDDGRLLALYTIKCNLDGPIGESEWGGLVIRQDWLDECGLTVPETIEEWNSVLRTFRDTYHTSPLMIGNPTAIDMYGAFLSAYGVLGEFYNDHGTIKYGPMEEGYKNYLIQMNQWYNEGIIDPNFTAVNFEWFHPELTTGKYGAGTCLYIMTGDAAKLAGYTQEEDFYLTPVTMPVLNKGDTPMGALTGSESIVFAKSEVISTKCRDIELACRYMDYWYSEEGMMYDSMGIEGVTYINNGDGTYQIGPILQAQLDNHEFESLQDALSTYTFNTAGFGLFNFATRQYLEPEASYNLAYEVWDQNRPDMMIPSFITMTPEESIAHNSIYTDIQTLTQENTVKFITGVRSFEEYDSFVEQIRQYGIDTCLNSYQNALDRYLAR